MVAAVLEPVNERWANVPENNFDLLTGPRWDAKSPKEQKAWQWMAGMARTPFHRFIFQTYAAMFRQTQPLGQERPEGAPVTRDEQSFLTLFNGDTLGLYEKQEMRLFISEFSRALSGYSPEVEAFHAHARLAAETMGHYAPGDRQRAHRPQPYGTPCQLMIEALAVDEANALMTLWNMSHGLLYLEDYAAICQPIQKLMALRSKLDPAELDDNNALIQIVVAYF